MELVIILFQLWTQPSVRILGFGREFAGFIPDPLTDLLRNPAYLKTFRETEKNFDTPQTYFMMRSFNSTTLIEKGSELEFFENEELLSLFGLYPRIGVAGRFGAWQRVDLRSYRKYGLWPYGQSGLLYALNIGKQIKLGSEYNCSWNNGPDWIYIDIADTLGHPQSAVIIHSEWSNEIGLGIIIADNIKWQFSCAGKKNSEDNNFTADTTGWFWPEDEQTEFENRYQNYYFNCDLDLT